MLKIIIADLKNKLSMSELNSEDYLTSCVFSYFNYIEDNWIEKFLNLFVNSNGENLNITIKESEFEFWQFYKNDSVYGGGAEPDVIIYSGEIAFIIEVKNHSQKSGKGIVDGNLHDQLAREFFIGREKMLKKKGIKKFFILYLTRHITFPKSDIEETISSIIEVDNSELLCENKLYWLSWKEIFPLLKEIKNINKSPLHYKMTSELLKFLKRRNLDSFSGFEFINKYNKKSLGYFQSIFYSQDDSRRYFDRLLPINIEKINTPIFYSNGSDSYFNFKKNINFKNTEGGNIFYGKRSDD